ncbi:FMN-binding glutamate synthase family protein [Candidatus Poribacteria bacterium]|nr:FMN-binding glutamate synthase family protein [Candidatus Poribacteria bacterium]
MSRSIPNASAATLTRNRVSRSPFSGICVTCIDGCLGPCEVGRSALRGREILYPQPYARVTAGSEKDYPVDFSHFNIHGSCVGAMGVEADSDKAVFGAVDVSTEIGAINKIKMKLPFFTGALGSTDIARVHWDSMAIGAALCGTNVVVGENVCGMDPNSEIRNGKVTHSPEMERRVKVYKKWAKGKGNIIIQMNVEDTRLGVAEYVIEKLHCEAIELKWGQGAKDIGGEVKLPSIERAQQLQNRGYIVHPDPDDEIVQHDFRNGDFKEFERHSRLGMVVAEEFHNEVERLRRLGAKYVTLKTGAYRPRDLALAVKLASDAKIDLLTVDGAGGGTGMSPWRMMNEWGIPTVQLECILYNCLKKLDEKGAFIPSCAIAGGIALEDQIFKAIAMGAPYIKAVCMGRGTMTATMVGNTIGNIVASGKNLPTDLGKYGNTIEQVFGGSAELKKELGADFEDVPPGAIGMYNYYTRLSTGLKQLMAGARKFALKYISRDDIFALTREASEVSGIHYVMDADKEEMDKILGV